MDGIGNGGRASFLGLGSSALCGTALGVHANPLVKRDVTLNAGLVGICAHVRRVRKVRGGDDVNVAPVPVKQVQAPATSVANVVGIAPP